MRLFTVLFSVVWLFQQRVALSEPPTLPEGDGSTRAAALTAGVASIEITPPPGYRMSGYFNERRNTGTHDPLWAKALYLEQGDVRAALVFCDLIGMSAGVVNPARQLTEEHSGVSASNILIAATHSHTGPLYNGALREHFHELAVSRDGSDPCETIDYPAELTRKLAEAVAAARSAAQPVELKTGVTEQQGLSFNRRFHMKDGTVVFNPGKLNPNIVRVAGPIDPEVGVIELLRPADRKPLAVLTVFALHLDTVGGTDYSADFPYYLQRGLREKLGAGLVSLFGNGCCGDINHIDVTSDRKQGGQAEAQRIGTTLAATVDGVLARLKPESKPALAVRSATVNVPLQRYSPEQIAAAKRDMLKVGTRELPFLDQVEAVKIVSLAMRGVQSLPLEVQVFRLGTDTAVVGLPGEVFVELGLAIKQASPFAQTLVVELANENPHYVPTRKAFIEGSYETVNSLIAPGGGEMLVEAAVDLLSELQP